jgi:hypothetical protein
MQTSKLVQLAALLIITAGSVLAQGTPQQPTPSPSASPSPSPTEPSVTAIKELKPRVISMVGTLELDDIVEVDLENLEKWAETNDA